MLHTDIPLKQDGEEAQFDLIDLIYYIISLWSV